MLVLGEKPPGIHRDVRTVIGQEAALLRARALASDSGEKISVWLNVSGIAKHQYTVNQSGVILPRSASSKGHSID